MPGPVSDVLYRLFGWPSYFEYLEASVNVQCVAFLAGSVRCILRRRNTCLLPCLGTQSPEVPSIQPFAVKLNLLSGCVGSVGPRCKTAPPP